jgi:hypothetical protein
MVRWLLHPASSLDEKLGQQIRCKKRTVNSCQMNNKFETNRGSKSLQPTKLSHECWLQYLCIKVPNVRKAVLDGVSWQKNRTFPTISSLGLPTNAIPVRNWTDWDVPTFLSVIVEIINSAQSKVPHWDKASTMYFLMKWLHSFLSWNKTVAGYFIYFFYKKTYLFT